MSRDPADALAGLGPERRRLLELLQRGAGAPAASAPPARPPEVEPALVATHPRKAAKQKQYDTINRSVDLTPAGEYASFLNYGYVPTDAPAWARVVPGPTQIDRHSRRLLLEVIGDWEVDGARIVDVGCGRGGAAVVLKEHFRPASYLGIDLSLRGIEFCRKHHRDAVFDFRQGDAEEIPVADGGADVVINVESSHCYPDVDVFYREVARVLAPGGRFLYTDFFPRAGAEALASRLAAAGLEVEREQDISRNVLLSCDELSTRRLSLFAAPRMRGYMANVLAAPGSVVYENLSSGATRYLLVRARRREA